MRLVSKFKLLEVLELPFRISSNGHRIVMSNSSWNYTFSINGELISKRRSDCSTFYLTPFGAVKILHDNSSKIYHALLFKGRRIIGHVKSAKKPQVGIDGSIAVISGDELNELRIVAPPKYKPHIKVRIEKDSQMAIYDKDRVAVLYRKSKNELAWHIMMFYCGQKHTFTFKPSSTDRYPSIIRFCGADGECVILNTFRSSATNCKDAAIFFDHKSGKICGYSHNKYLLFNVGKYLVAQGWDGTNVRRELELINKDTSVPVHEIDGVIYSCNTFGTLAIVVTNTKTVYVFDTTYDEDAERNIFSAVVQSFAG